LLYILDTGKALKLLCETFVKLADMM